MKPLMTEPGWIILNYPKKHLWPLLKPKQEIFKFTPLITKPHIFITPVWKISEILKEIYNSKFLWETRRILTSTAWHWLKLTLEPIYDSPKFLQFLIFLSTSQNLTWRLVEVIRFQGSKSLKPRSAPTKKVGLISHPSPRRRTRLPHHFDFKFQIQ